MVVLLAAGINDSSELRFTSLVNLHYEIWRIKRIVAPKRQDGGQSGLADQTGAVSFLVKCISKKTGDPDFKPWRNQDILMHYRCKY